MEWWILRSAKIWLSIERSECCLNEQRKIHEQQKSLKKLHEEEESKNELIREKAVLIKSMKVAENCVDQGNTESENLTKSKIKSWEKIFSILDKCIWNGSSKFILSLRENL